MFVDAPKLPDGGYLELNRTAVARSITGDTWGSLASAQSSVNTMNSSASVLGASTQRGQMTSGIVNGRYMDTNYYAVYRNWKSDGFTKMVVYNPATKLYCSCAYPLGLGYWGFHGSGHTASLGDIIPWGSSSTAAAIYNRAAIMNMQNRAKTELRLKALDTNFDGAEFMTGLRPSVRMVSERVIGLVRAFIAVRKGNFSSAAYHLGLKRIKNWKDADTADLWLEMYYGWKPLVSDIFDGSEEIIDAVNRKASDEDRNNFYTRKRRLATDLLVIPNPGTTVWTDLKSEGSGRATVEVKLRYKIADSFTAYMSQLRLNNPAYIAWTALPYSFVIDWLVPVGDMLAALNAPIGLDFKGGYMTTRSIGTVSLRGSTRPPSPAYTVISRTGTATATHKAMYIQRTGLFTWPTVNIYFRVPLRSFERAASAVSLIAAAKKYR